MLYETIFFTNVLRILEDRKMTKLELSKLSGVSISFLSDLTNGKANPSLRVMEEIALALGVPLSYLLETTDLDQATLKLLEEQKPYKLRLPEGYERVTAILPEHKAFLVKKWEQEAKESIAELTEENEST